ncbi:MAG: polyamine aminopropyltransferase, partial [Acetobacteraceae bacterium]
VGGFMTLGWAAKDARLTGLDLAEIERRAIIAGILGHTRYWTPAVHEAAFQLPPYIAELLER